MLVDQSSQQERAIARVFEVGRDRGVPEKQKILDRQCALECAPGDEVEADELASIPYRMRLCDGGRERSRTSGLYSVNVALYP